MMKKSIFILNILFVLFLIVSCGGTEKGKTVVSTVNIPQVTQGMITFTTGDVQKFQNNEWTDAEINDFVEKGDTVKVETDSFCEIQFGKTAVIKIEENTELVIPSLNTAAGSTDISVKMITGSVLSKVNKLTSGDSFSVQTQSAACGVRGTQFMVTAEGDSDTLLAVKEGSVVIVPSKFDLDKLFEKIPADKNDVYISLKNIEKSLTVVNADQEIAISSEDMVRIEKTYEDLEKAVSLYQEKGEKKSSDEIKSLSDLLVKELSVTTSLTDRNKEKMEYLDTMVIRDLPDSADESITDKLVTVSVTVNFKDAQVIRNRQIIGRGGFSAIVNNGEEVNLLIRKRGYFDKELVFTAESNSENKYEVILEKDPDAKEFAEIKIIAEPADAEIVIDSVSEGTGTVVKEMLSDKAYSVLVKKEGFQKKYLNIVNPKENETVEVKLLPSIEKRIRVSNGSLTGYTAFSAGKIITADTYGELAAADAGGSVLWKQQTGNTPNERAFPVVSGNRVYFSGASEFIISDLSSGSVINSVFLEDEASHVFGRRVVLAGDEGFYPANSGLIRFSPDTGDFKESIEIPGGTRMTPTYYNGDLLVVSQKGVFFRIDPVTGNIKSQIQTEAVQPVVNNVAVSDGKAFFNGRKGKVVCIDLASDKVKWTNEIVPGKTLMITGDLQCTGNALFAFSGGRIYILSAETGKRLSAPISGVASPPVASGKRLYYGTTAGLFVSADADTGKTADTININAKITASPVFSKGKVYIGTSKGEVLVLNP